MLGARAGFGLPYFRADMRWRRDGDASSTTASGGGRPRGNRRTWTWTTEIGTPRRPRRRRARWSTSWSSATCCLPATRVLGLLRGRVHHQPYPLRQARVHRLEQSLLAAAGITAAGERTPDWFSEGVDVDIFPPHRLGKRR